MLGIFRGEFAKRQQMILFALLWIPKVELNTFKKMWIFFGLVVWKHKKNKAETPSKTPRRPSSLPDRYSPVKNPAHYPEAAFGFRDETDFQCYDEVVNIRKSGNSLRLQSHPMFFQVGWLVSSRKHRFQWFRPTSWQIDGKLWQYPDPTHQGWTGRWEGSRWIQSPFRARQPRKLSNKRSMTSRKKT